MDQVQAFTDDEEAACCALRGALMVRRGPWTVAISVPGVSCVLDDDGRNLCIGVSRREPGEGWSTAGSVAIPVDARSLEALEEALVGTRRLFNRRGTRPTLAEIRAACEAEPEDLATRAST